MPTEPDGQTTMEQCPSSAVPASRSRARGLLVLAALLVAAASAASAWWLGAIAACAVYAAGTLALAGGLLVLGRRSAAR